MRKLLFITMMLPLFLSGQSVYTLEGDGVTYTFEYNPSLGFILDDYFEGYRDYGIPMDRFSHFRGIYVTSQMERLIGSSAWGVTFLDAGTIYVNNNVPYYLPAFMSIIIYHEFYHFVLEEGRHCIMSAETPTIVRVIESFLRGYPECPYILQGGQSINIEEAIRIWNDDTKEEYFKYILDRI